MPKKKKQVRRTSKLSRRQPKRQSRRNRKPLVPKPAKIPLWASVPILLPPTELVVVAKISKKSPLKNIFDIGEVDGALVGTPKEVQKELDGLALWMQKHPKDEVAFARIHTYIHKYLLGLVFKKFSFVRGNDENDIYQEALIAISKKAIPKFNPNKGMSFLNFAKMCINRHLITILHASNHRRKDQPINQAISLDQCPMENEDGNCLLSNVITDDKHSAPPYKEMANRESYQNSLEALKSKLSRFEILILEQYLQDLSYKDIARNVSRITGVRYNEKSCDNALLRIRKKSSELKAENKDDYLPSYF